MALVGMAEEMFPCSPSQQSPFHPMPSTSLALAEFTLCLESWSLILSGSLEISSSESR